MQGGPLPRGDALCFYAPYREEMLGNHRRGGEVKKTQGAHSYDTSSEAGPTSDGAWRAREEGGEGGGRDGERASAEIEVRR